MRTLETVDRALQMLLAFDAEERQELTVAALATRMRVHRSSASRLAATLAQRGFLERAPGSEAFRLGPAIGRLGLLALGGRALISAAREAMERLAGETGEAVVLSVREGDEVVDVAQVESPHRIGVRNWIGRRAPLHASSDGKALLAFDDDGETPAPEGPLAALTPRTLTRAGELAEELERVRARGWATAVGELEEGLNGVAVPVRDGGGRCVAALSVSGPAYRLSPERLAEIAPLVQRAGGAIGERLGRGT